MRLSLFPAGRQRGAAAIGSSMPTLRNNKSRTVG